MLGRSCIGIFCLVFEGFECELMDIDFSVILVDWIVLMILFDLVKNVNIYFVELMWNVIVGLI